MEREERVFMHLRLGSPWSRRSPGSPRSSRSSPSSRSGVRGQRAELCLQAADPVVLIALDPKSRVHQPVIQPGDPVGPLKPDGPEPGSSIVQGTPQGALPSHASVGEPNTPRSEHRTRVTLAARLQIAAEPLEIASDLWQAELEVHPLLRAEIVGTERLPRDVAEPLSEGIELSPTDGEAGSHVMASVPLQQIATGEECVVKVEAGGAAPRALPDLSVERNQKRRT